MFTDIYELRNDIKNKIYSLVIQEGWVKIFEETNSNRFKSSIRSFMTNINNINQYSPFRDTHDDFEFPYVRLKNNNQTFPSEIQARNIIVAIRDLRDNSVTAELNQELKIIMGLLEQKNPEKSTYSKVRSDKSLDKAVIVKNTEATINWLQLNQLLSAEECLVIDFYFEFKVTPELLNNIKKDFKVVSLPGRNLIYERFANEGGPYIRISGKKILRHMHSVKPNNYFKIGYKDNGDIEYCHIHKDLEIPNHLQIRQLFFDRRVLTKYEQSQFFKVDAMRLKCKTWSLQIFNNQTNIISILFPHIVKQLPEDEYLHWIAYNILPAPDDLLMTKSEFDTAAQGKPHLPSRNDHKFKRLINYYFAECSKKKITPVLKKLNQIDNPYFNTLNLIPENSQWHFDLQILSLSKILIESVDTKELTERKITKDGTKNMLKNYIGSDQSSLCDFLDNLYNIRLGAAHRRASDLNTEYYKGIKFFSEKYGKDLIHILNGIFNEACLLINLLTKKEDIRCYDDLYKNL